MRYIPNPNQRVADLLGQSLGEGIGGGLSSYFSNKALNNVIEDESLENASPSERMGAIQKALAPYGERGKQMFMQRMQIEQQHAQDEEQRILGKAQSGKELSEKDFAKVSPQNLMKLQEMKSKKQFGKNIYENLKKAGYPEETAQLWQNQTENATVAGMSDVIKNVNDLLRRTQSGKGLQEQQQPKTEMKPTIEIPGVDLEPLELDFPELPEPIGLTPSDMVKQNEHREKVNTPLYTETVDRLNALDEEFRNISYMQELNEKPGALPTGFEKWNVNWDTGDLRFKGAASPDAQAYVKTIAQMARRAKDFFPGRVTNFDLDQFKQGFPTLANTPEGRRLISQQLALANRIAYLKDETYKAAVDHYGSGADPILIKKEATANYRRLKGQLESQLKSISNEAQSMAFSQSENNPIESATTLDELFP